MLARVRGVVATCSVSSPVGGLRLAATSKGVVRIAFPRGSGSSFEGWLAQRLADHERAEHVPVLDKLVQQLEEYFAGRRREFDLPLDLRGTPFQCAVWRALGEIPFGETRSYADVARRIRRPRAVRAVGAANGANPVPIVVPCHRVITSAGKLGGFGGGLATKRALLAHEQTRTFALGG
jgi:O-6-methylguanine DNA methyltransferase